MQHREPYWRVRVPRDRNSPLMEYIMARNAVKILKPTGKWRLRREHTQDIDMEVQHQAWLCKVWVSEEDIIYLCPKVVVHRGDCS